MMTNLQQRLIIAALGIPLLLSAAIRGGWLLFVVIAAIQVIAFWEWRKLAAGNKANVWIPSIVGVAALDYLVFSHGERSSMAIFFLLLSCVMLVEVWRTDRQPLRNLGATLLFLAYVALPLALWGILQDIPAAFRWQPLGPLALLFVSTWICDTAAYFGGKQFGRRKLHVAASPNKTVEGFLAGLVFSAAALPIAAALHGCTPAPLDYVVLPLIVGLAGQIGDLLESLMKREIQVKDTSAVLPGHGGMLDRFDSLLISSPLLFAYLLVSPA